MNTQNYVKVIPLTSRNSNTVGAVYLAINTAGLPEACSAIRISNMSDEDVLISFDGVIDHEFIESGAVIQLPFQSNSSPKGEVAQLHKGTKVYIKGTAGIGYIYLSGYYS